MVFHKKTFFRFFLSQLWKKWRAVKIFPAPVCSSCLRISLKRSRRSWELSGWKFYVTRVHFHFFAQKSRFLRDILLFELDLIQKSLFWLVFKSQASQNWIQFLSRSLIFQGTCKCVLGAFLLQNVDEKGPNTLWGFSRTLLFLDTFSRTWVIGLEASPLFCTPLTLWFQM